MQGLEKNLNKAKEYLEKFAKAKDVEVIIVW
jgi:hypothetical protein